MTPDQSVATPADSRVTAAARSRTMLACLVVAVAALAAYANSFRGPYIFDDMSSITENATIRSLAQAWWPPHGAAAGGLSVAGRPFLNFTLGVNYAVSGFDVWSYHALNLAIHLLAGLALFGVLRRTFTRPILSARFGEQAWLLALAIATLWTVHPLQTEAVTYIIQRAESLMGLFFLLTLYGFVRALDSPRPRRWWVFSFAACLLGVATKEITALAPVLVFLYDRTFVSGSFREAWRRHRWQHLSLVVTWLPLLWFLAGTGGDRGGTFHFSQGNVWVEHALTQFEAVTRYFWLSLCPYPLVFDYGELPAPSLGVAFLWAIPVLGLLGATVVALKRWPVVGFLGAWVFVILAPTSVLPAKLQIIVEHRMYLPLAAVLTFVAGWAWLRAGRNAVYASFGLAVVAGVLTAARNGDYRSNIILWRDTIAKSPANPRAHNNLGYFLNAEGRTMEAIAEYQRALRINPDYIDAHNNLGSALQDLPGRMNEAIAQYQEALRLKPDYPQVHYNLGSAWLKTPGRLNDAIAEFQTALHYKPDYAEAHSSLGTAWSKIPGRLDDAVAEFQTALRLKPDYAEGHFNLANTWVTVPGRLNDAIAHYQEALRLKPGLVEAHTNLGNAWMNLPGRLNDAMAQYQEALRLKPDSPTAHYNLGNALATLPGRLNEAIAQYQEALRLQPDYAEAHYNLGNALVNVPGRMNEVIARYAEAVRLKPDYVEAHLNLGNALYAVGRVPDAIAQFSETLRLQPNQADAHFNLALALLNLPGRVNEARLHLEAVLRLQPGNDDARQILAKIRAGQR